ncbi:hypothetical protein [Desulfofarcimen acetoxidans]|uniref:hypothetical protein n=1 Tax=Desulfofarcimen acetoxidans TaxID=58138 RepID=UPI0005A92A02|nr:hypothetical protein [Desulfofarcimen acetoxidans]
MSSEEAGVFSRRQTCQSKTRALWLDLQEGWKLNFWSLPMDDIYPGRIERVMPCIYSIGSDNNFN